MRQKGEPWRGGGLRLRPLPRALGPPAAPPPCAVARLRQSVSGEWSRSAELVERRALDGYAALRRPTPTRD